MTDDRRPTTDDREPRTDDGRAETADAQAAVGYPSSVVGGPSSSRELKPEQQLAAHTLDRHISVTAGPGAGKTTVLVERYLHIVRSQEISVDQIVAITFTNRAANEMRERLRKELDTLLWSAPPTERAKWMRHKRTLDGAIITTIHGFCARLLREFPVEADIDPQFALLDAQQSAMLEESVAEESLTEFISANHQAITELTAGVGRARLARGLIDIYRSMRNQGLTLGQLAEATDKTHKTLHDYNTAIEELKGKAREFISVGGLSSTAEEKRQEARARWPALLDLLVTAPESKSPAEVSEAIQEFREATRPGSQRKIGDLVKALDELIWEKNLRCRVPQIFFDLYARRYAKELVAVVERIERRLDEEKRRRSALDFDDLQVRALRLLEERPEVLRRTSGRYRFLLVDEFQDTNALQRDLMAKLALDGPDMSEPAEGDTESRRPKTKLRTNLFFVGDRKQSIYGFRGADVDVFREITSRIEARNGLSIPLNRNFRSQLPLIRFFNVLFEHIFERDPSIASDELNELGYVEHEPSVAAREDQDAPPLVELLIDSRADNKKGDQWSDEPPRVRDAEQLALRIIALVGTTSISAGGHGPRELRYRDIALLFRAMTEVYIYESAFRRAGIPYVTVQGRGFYAREEITDFVQLLRFLDNKSDEVALAAVLRSPICGISDNTLLALRCAPLRAGEKEHPRLQRHGGVRPLLGALRKFESIDFIDGSDQKALERARELLNELTARAKRSGLSELLRFAVEISEYRTVCAANFDGAQRLANIEKLFTLAERFERSGAYLIRDFVRFVREFEEAGGRESEGQIDDSADAVRLMSIHQAKGLEFPVVIIPDLHRQPDNRREWWAIDRHLGLTLKVPDGRGRQAAGAAYVTFGERAKRRDEFESMRLLYVAATRAQDRLILSGAQKDLPAFKTSWLGWIGKALEVRSDSKSGLHSPAEGVDFQLTQNLLDTLPDTASPNGDRAVEPDLKTPIDESFPLIAPIPSERSNALHRFSVTQLLNYQRCPRQYYFDRVLHVPGEDEVAVWNDADAPEPPANLTATLRGAVVHRFCEKFQPGDDLRDCLKTSFEDVVRQRAAELGDRISEIDSQKALRDLLPLAQNYAQSKVRDRIESARLLAEQSPGIARRSPGVFSEQRFRLRRPLGILTGTIDKLLVFPGASGEGLSVEIIDFKTNRFRGRGEPGGDAERFASSKKQIARRGTEREQLSFGFLESESEARVDRDLLIRAEVEAAATDYRVQMQAYALAARDLIPEVVSVRVTLHFLDPDIEVCLSEELVDREVCANAIDETMLALVSSIAPESFPANPAEHCRICNFVDMCAAGKVWLQND